MTVLADRPESIADVHVGSATRTAGSDRLWLGVHYVERTVQATRRLAKRALARRDRRQANLLYRRMGLAVRYVPWLRFELQRLGFAEPPTALPPRSERRAMLSRMIAFGAESLTAVTGEGMPPMAAPVLSQEAPREDWCPLTPRQLEVARLIARGYSNKQIAHELVVTIGTVTNHVEHILNRLGLSCRAQVAAWVVGHGLSAAGHGDGYANERGRRGASVKGTIARRA